MPPKKQNSKAQIIEKAYEIVRSNGYEELSARKLAKELSCSTQPIYQAFPDMISLKIEIVKKAQQLMMDIIQHNTKEGFPLIVSNILGYVQFAEEEKNLYRLMYSPELSTNENMEAFYPSLDPDEMNLLIYAHGIVMMRSFGALHLTQEEIQKMIMNAYELFCAKVRN